MKRERVVARRIHSACMVLAVLSVSSTNHHASALNAPSVWSSPSSRVVSQQLSKTAMAMTAMRRRLTEGEGVTKPKSKQQHSSQKHALDENILDDGFGGVNSELATTLWNWEQQHRENAKLPKLSLSTRQGLRLVNDIVNSIAESPRGQRLMNHGSDDDTVRTDLVQEGVMALMDALQEYRQSTPSDSNGEGEVSLEEQNQRFEAYARPYLEDRLWSTLDTTSRPVQLPKTESQVWKTIQEVRPKLQAELGGRPPTVAELASRLELPPEKLELLLAARRRSLSMESTVEIINPDSLEDQTSHFTDQDEWESREGHLLDTGKKVIKEEIAVGDEELMDYQYEGEDEMWIHQTQVAAPLRDIIPDDGEPSPDDIALSEMIRHDVSEFLTKSLTQEEVTVVRLSFGLDGEEQLTWDEICKKLGSDMTPDRVKDILKDALEKLRTTYRINYVEAHLDEDGIYGDYGEDSV